MQIKRRSGQVVTVLIDDSDVELVESSGPWRLLCLKRGTYVQRHASKGEATLLHRFLLGNPPCVVDHINGNTLDNRRANLRHASQSQNGANSRIPTTNKSGYKGVGWHGAARKWKSAIQVNGETIHLGLYDDPSEAHAQYMVAADFYFGSYARPR